MIALLNRQRLLKWKFGSDFRVVSRNGLRAIYSQFRDSHKLFKYRIYDPTGVELNVGIVAQDDRYATPDEAVSARLESFSTWRRMMENEMV